MDAYYTNASTGLGSRVGLEEKAPTGGDLHVVGFFISKSVVGGRHWNITRRQLGLVCALGSHYVPLLNLRKTGGDQYVDGPLLRFSALSCPPVPATTGGRS